MEEEFQIDGLVERYLKGELEGERLSEVEARIKEDPPFAELVELRRKSLAVLATAGRESLRERFKSIHQEMEAEEQEETKSTVSRFPRSRAWIAVAATILLLLVPLYFLLSSPSSTNTELYASYFQPGQDRVFTESRAVGDVDYTNAIKLFKQGNYEAALPGFQERVEVLPDSLIFHLYTGVCYLGLKRLPDSRGEFQYIINKGNTFLRPSAEWYQGLSYLQEDNQAEARSHFEYLVNYDGESLYQENAEEILDQLDSQD